MFKENNVDKILTLNNENKVNFSNIKFFDSDFNLINHKVLKDSGDSLHISSLEKTKNLSFVQDKDSVILDYSKPNEVSIKQLCYSYIDNHLFLDIVEVEKILIKNNNIKLLNDKRIILSFLYKILSKIDFSKEGLLKLKKLADFEESFTGKKNVYTIKKFYKENINNILNMDNNIFNKYYKYPQLVENKFYKTKKDYTDYELSFFEEILNIGDKVEIDVSFIVDFFTNISSDYRKSIFNIMSKTQTDNSVLIYKLLEEYSILTNSYLNTKIGPINLYDFTSEYIRSFMSSFSIPSSELVTIRLSNIVSSFNKSHIIYYSVLELLKDSYNLDLFYFMSGYDFLYSLYLLDKSEFSKNDLNYVMYLTKERSIFKNNESDKVLLIDCLIKNTNNIDMLGLINNKSNKKVTKFEAKIILGALKNLNNLNDLDINLSNLDLFNTIEAINNICLENPNIDIYKFLTKVIRMIFKEGFFDITSINGYTKNSNSYIQNHLAFDLFYISFPSTLNFINKNKGIKYSNLNELYLKVFQAR